MTDRDISAQDIEEERGDAEANRRKQSRRSLLAAMGAGAAGLALGGLTETASASGESSPAAEFVDSTSAATTATSDGDWSDSAVWDNGVPTAEQTVRIDSGVTVTVDTTTEDITNLDVAGTLTFARDTDTHLRAETIVTRPESTLEIGTESNPIQPGSEARTTFVHHEDISEKDHDPERISKGLITMGDVEIHGAEKTSWDELATAPTAGDTSIELANEPAGWQTGDDIVLPGLEPDPNSPEDEERTIASISGTTVTFDEPLEYDHVPPENNLERELSAYVLNLSRNVVMQSDPDIEVEGPTDEQPINRQGHVMIMQPASSVNYVRLRHLGRTNKRYFTTTPIWSEIPDNDWRTPSEPNPLARYGFHYHETGIDEDPHEAEGLVVQDNPGWGVVNHHSHAEVTDSITYRCLGSGFSAEAGDERGSFERCFALRSRGSGEHVTDARSDLRKGPNELGTGQIMEFGFEGTGFWLQGPTVAIDDCVAAGHRNYAFKLWGQPLFDGGQYQDETYDTSDFYWSFDWEPNFPVDLASDDGMLVDDVDYDTSNGLVSSLHLPFRSFANNTAFASGGGVQYSGRYRPQPHGTIESFTGYNFYWIRDRHGNQLDGHKGQGQKGQEGKTGILTYRYAGSLRVVDAQITDIDDSGNGSSGVFQNHYSHGPRVEDSLIETDRWGVRIRDTGDATVDNVTFGRGGPGVHDINGRTESENVSLSNITSLDGDLGISIPVGRWRRGIDQHSLLQLFSENPQTLDGRAIYFPFQDPDFVPFESESDIPGGSLGGVVGANDPSQVVGKTNQELQDEFGTSVYDELTPPEAKDVPYLNPGKIVPLVWPRRPSPDQVVFFDASAVADTDAAASYEWELGDGTTLTGESPTHTFDSAGNYDVTLTVTDGNGNTNETETYVHVLDEAPDADETVTVAPGGTHEFSPADLEINPGDTVAFEWDSGGHTVTVDSQPDDASWSGVDSTLTDGTVYTHTFDVEGTYEYYCRPHQSEMQGSIAVTENYSAVYDVATDQNDPTDELVEQDLQDAVAAYDDDGELDGIRIHTQDLIDLIQQYNGTQSRDEAFADSVNSTRDGGGIDDLSVPDTVDAGEQVTVTVDTSTTTGTVVEFSSDAVVLSSSDGIVTGNRVEFFDISGGDSTHTVEMTAYPSEASLSVDIAAWANTGSQTDADSVTTDSLSVDGTVEATGLFDADRWDSSGPASHGVSQSEDAVAFSYDSEALEGETWNYTTTALSNDEIQLDWEYSAHHSWYSAEAEVAVSVDGAETTLVDLGDTHGSFSESGTTTISVSAGDTLQFEIYGYHYDSSENKYGEFTISEASSLGGPAADETEPAPAADETVTVAPGGSHEFSPSSLTVEPGTTVAFEWDAGGHTVTVDSQPEEANWSGVDSTQAAGTVDTFTFDVVGTYDYHCRPHQSEMQGTITVESASGDPTVIEEAIDADDDGEIDDDEVLTALDYWEDEETVPGTGGETISDQEIMDLIEQWHEGGQ